MVVAWGRPVWTEALMTRTHTHDDGADVRRRVQSPTISYRIGGARTKWRHRGPRRVTIKKKKSVCDILDRKGGKGREDNRMGTDRREFHDNLVQRLGRLDAVHGDVLLHLGRRELLKRGQLVWGRGCRSPPG